MDALQQQQKEGKQISSIEQWVVCFNAFISVVALQQPQRVRDLLPYSSIIVKAAHDYEGKPWLSDDTHFRTLGTTMGLQSWGQVDLSLWSQHFNRATQHSEASNALLPGGGKSHCRKRAHKDESRPEGEEQTTPPLPPPRVAPICWKYNTDGCRSPTCTYRHIFPTCHGQRQEGCSHRPKKETNMSSPPFRKIRWAELTALLMAHCSAGGMERHYFDKQAPEHGSSRDRGTICLRLVQPPLLFFQYTNVPTKMSGVI